MASTPAGEKAFLLNPRSSLSVFLLVILLDAVLTGPFVFEGPAEGDTLRYALGLWRWIEDGEPLGRAFNAEMSFGYYGLLRGLRSLQGQDLWGLPTLLNRCSWAAGVLASGLFYLVGRRWLGAKVALRWALLLLAAPAWWSLHLYGNANLVGFAAAAGALGCFPIRGDVESKPALTRWRLIGAGALGTIALLLRVDMLLLGPAILGLALWRREPRILRRAAVLSLACAGAFVLLRLAVLGLPDSGGTFARHLQGNLRWQDPRWSAQNILFLASGGPVLVALASLLAWFTQKGENAGRMRRLVALWFLPALPFIFFAGVHLTRILIPLLPAILLPLAFWAASGDRRRDAVLLILVVASHVVMLPTPKWTAQLLDRSPAERRASHYHFLGNMFADHGAMQERAVETLEDARSMIAHDDGPVARPAVIVGADVIYYEYALQATFPRLEVSTLGLAFKTRLQQAVDPESGRVWYLLVRRPGSEVEEILRRFGVVSAVRIHHTVEERLNERGDRTATEQSGTPISGMIPDGGGIDPVSVGGTPASATPRGSGLQNAAASS